MRHPSSLWFGGMNICSEVQFRRGFPRQIAFGGLLYIFSGPRILNIHKKSRLNLRRLPYLFVIIPRSTR